MKKIIGILSSFASVFSISTIVACKINKNQGFNNNKNNKNDNNNPFTSKDDSIGSEIDMSLFAVKLKEIDGSILNNNTTISDALNLVKNVIVSVEAACKNIRFINTDEKVKFLSKGDNHFRIAFDIKNKNFKFPVIIKNVKDANELNKDELEIYINEILNDKDLLKVGYENEDINTNDTTKWSKVISQKIHEKAKNATISVIKTEGSKPGEWEVTIEVGNLPYGIQKITKQTLYISNIIETIKTPDPISNSFDEAAKVFDKGTTVTRVLTTHNKKKDALNEIEKDIVGHFKDYGLSTPLFEYDFLEINKNLVVGENEIKFGIKNPETNKVTYITFSLIGVTKGVETYTYQNMVTENLSKGFSAYKINDKDTYETILLALNNYAKRFSNNLEIKLKDMNQMKTLLKVGDNKIDVVIATIKANWEEDWIGGEQPIYFTALITNVQSFNALEEVKKRYEKEIKFKQITPAYTYATLIYQYQKEIDQSFPTEKIKISLKDSSKSNQKLSKGKTVIEVNYNQNGKTVAGVIKPIITVKTVTWWDQ